MVSKHPPIDADLDTSEAEAGHDPLYDELVRLRVLGLRQDITTKLPLPELTQIADAVCPSEDAGVERLKCAMKKAAERFGGKYGMALEALWGVDSTYGWLYGDRRNKAMPLLGGTQTKSVYEKSHRERTARDFAAQLRALYEEAGGAEGAPHGWFAIERPRSVLRTKLSTRRAIVGLARIYQ